MDGNKLHIQGAHLEREICKKLLHFSIDEVRKEVCECDEVKHSASVNSSRKSTSLKARNSSVLEGKICRWNNRYGYTSKHWKPIFKYSIINNSSSKLKEQTRNVTRDFLFNEYRAKLKTYNYVFKHYPESRSYIQHYRKYHSSTYALRSLSARTFDEIDATIYKNRDALIHTPTDKGNVPAYAAETLSFLLKENTSKGSNRSKRDTTKFKLVGQSASLDSCLIYKYKFAPNYMNTLLGQLPVNIRQNGCILMDPSGTKRITDFVNNQYTSKITAATFNLTKRNSDSGLAMNNSNSTPENSIAPQGTYTKLASTSETQPVNGIHPDVTAPTTRFPVCAKTTELLTATIDTKNLEKHESNCSSKVNLGFPNLDCFSFTNRVDKVTHNNDDKTIILWNTKSSQIQRIMSHYVDDSISQPSVHNDSAHVTCEKELVLHDLSGFSSENTCAKSGGPKNSIDEYHSGETNCASIEMQMPTSEKLLPKIMMSEDSSNGDASNFEGHIMKRKSSSGTVETQKRAVGDSVKMASLYFDKESVLKYVKIAEKNKPLEKTAIKQKKIIRRIGCVRDLETRGIDRFNRSLKAYRKNYHKEDNGVWKKVESQKNSCSRDGLRNMNELMKASQTKRENGFCAPDVILHDEI